MTEDGLYFEPEPGAQPPPANAIRVLVVEDEQDAVRTLLAILRLEGYDARGVTNGSRTLAAVRDFNPDVVILDIHLSGLSGWQLARDIHADTAPRRPLLIGVSGKYTQGADKILSELAGFDYYLLKPADPKVLLTLVEKAKERRSSQLHSVHTFPKQHPSAA